MPYKTAVGTTYDSGDFATVVERAWRSPTTRASGAQRESKKKGLLRGLGVCFVLEHSGGSPIEGTQVSFPGGER
jgi:carbon-monoxide dehydrogenase large subunit